MRNSQFKLPKVENVFLFSALLFKKYDYKWPGRILPDFKNVLKKYRVWLNMFEKFNEINYEYSSI